MYGDGDFYNMKGVVEEFLEKLGMRDRVHYDPKAGKNYLHPGRQANICYDEKLIGYLGEVHPVVADNYGIGEPQTAEQQAERQEKKREFGRKLERAEPCQHGKEVFGNTICLGRNVTVGV